MFKPVNDNVIVKKQVEENVTSSGIITSNESKTTYLVVETNEHTQELKDKVIYLSTEPTKLEENYYAVNIKDIVAYASGE